MTINPLMWLMLTEGRIIALFRSNVINEAVALDAIRELDSLAFAAGLSVEWGA